MVWGLEGLVGPVPGVVWGVSLQLPCLLIGYRYLQAFPVSLKLLHADCAQGIAQRNCRQMQTGTEAKQHSANDDNAKPSDSAGSARLSMLLALSYRLGLLL